MWNLLPKMKIMRWKWLKNEKNEKTNFCQDQEGHQGGMNLMNAMHIDAFVFHIFFWCQIFFYFGINIVLTFATILSLYFIFSFGILKNKVMLQKYSSEDSIFVNHNLWWQYGTNTWHAQKVTLCLRHQNQNQIFTTFGKLYNMSKTCLWLSQLRFL